ASFVLASRAVELGYDLRAVCRELSRVVRGVVVMCVDASRVNDPEIAAEAERERLKALAARFSREDLLRAFDLLTKAETDIRAAAQPRYHLEMALLRWIYLRKIVPIEDLIAGTANAGATGPGLHPPQKGREPFRRAEPPRAQPPQQSGATVAPVRPAQPPSFKDALLAEIRKSKMVFYSTVVAQAQKIEVAGDRVVFTFSPNQKALVSMVEQNRAWLESLAQQVSGRRMAIAAVQTDAPGTQPSQGGSAQGADPKSADKKTALRDKALADAGVQTMLEVFPAEIRDVEEM